MIGKNKSIRVSKTCRKPILQNPEVQDFALFREDAILHTRHYTSIR